jgi:hypothetical protein
MQHLSKLSEYATVESSFFLHAEPVVPCSAMPSHILPHHSTEVNTSLLQLISMQQY